MKTTPRGYLYPEAGDMARNFPSIAATTITKIDADMTAALTRSGGGSVAPWQTGTAGADTVIDPRVGSYAHIRDNGDQTVTVACVLQSKAWPQSDTAVERELAVVPPINDWMLAAALIVPISFSTKSILKKDLRATLARFSYHSTGDLALIIEQPPGTRMADRHPIAFSVTLALPA